MFALRSFLLCLVAVANGAAAPTPVKIVGETKYKPHSLVRLRAEGADPKAALLWRVFPGKEVQRATSPRGVLEFVAPPGSYEVELLVIASADGNLAVEESHLTVELEGCSPVPPKPEPKPNPQPGKADPVQAIGKLRFGNAGCTATVIGPRRADGRWDILTAAHCSEGMGDRGTFTMKDGRTFAVTVAARNTTWDLNWLVTDNVVEEMPFAVLAEKNPAVGAEIWHMGYGIDKPGNREDGRIVGPETIEGQMQMELSVSSGDSGGGIFRSDTNELVAVVCCTTERGRKVMMYGGSTEKAAKLRPIVKTDESWKPVAIPQKTKKFLEACAPTPIPLVGSK